MGPMGLITHSIVKLALNVPAIIIFSQKGAYFGSQTLNRQAFKYLVEIGPDVLQ